MKIKLAQKAVYVLSALSVFLPWFTYNPQVMGYRWGFMFLPWMAVPVVVTGFYVFARGRRLPLVILAEISTTLNIAILAVAFGGWQEFANIAPGFQWSDGFHTATFGYWVSALLFLTQFVLLQVDISMVSKIDKSEPGKEI